MLFGLVLCRFDFAVRVVIFHVMSFESCIVSLCGAVSSGVILCHIVFDGVMMCHVVLSGKMSLGTVMCCVVSGHVGAFVWCEWSGALSCHFLCPVLR